TGQGPAPNPAHWQSCGPNCSQPRGEPQPDCLARGTAEFATWLAPAVGSRVHGNAPSVGLAAGTEATFPLAFDDALRVGPWLEYGGDSLDLVHPRGGLTFLVGGVHDPHFVPH